MSKPFCVWRDHGGNYNCGSYRRFSPREVLAEFDSYQDGAAFARQANLDEAEMQRVAQRERDKSAAKQGELAI